MASSLLTAAKPFFLFSPSQSPSPRIPPASTPLTRWKLDARRRSSLRVSSMAQKWEPSKVVPQGDRVLIRLEELPEGGADILQFQPDVVTKFPGCHRAK